MTTRFIRATLISGIALCAVHAEDADPAYRKQIEQYREKREAALKADGGWLTVTGLFWLKEGENTLGSDTANDIVLPDSSPARFGTIKLDRGTAVFTAASPSVTLNGKPVQQATVRYANPSDTLAAGPLDLFVIKRSERYAIRLKDKDSALRKHFTHVSFYPVQPDWRITAKFVPYASPAKLTFESIIGEQEIMTSPGYVEFEHAGQTYKLLAVEQGKSLFFVIRDKTSGKTTYAASRFLHTDAPKDGVVVLDFNKLENPPCAFTPYATCPLPPPQNRLPIAIEAGEMKYGDH
jgi:uncharacterized protein (DUF1684 family)